MEDTEADDIIYDVTVVIPTYGDCGIVRLLRGIDQVCARADLEVEIIVVDDTPDGSVARAVRGTVTVCHVELVQRSTMHAAWGGAAGAAVEGMALAQAPAVVVMGSDGRHPPAVIPTMYQMLEPRAWVANELVIASRYLQEVTPQEPLAPRLRAFWARFLFPKRIGKKTTDPLAGFFAVNIDCLDMTKVRTSATGVEILLTILATHPYLDVAEVPFVFRDHACQDQEPAGASFLRQLVRLRVDA